MNYTDDGLLRKVEEEISYALIAMQDHTGIGAASDRLARLHAEILAHHAIEDAYHTEQEALAATWAAELRPSEPARGPGELSAEAPWEVGQKLRFLTFDDDDADTRELDCTFAIVLEVSASGEDVRVQSNCGTRWHDAHAFEAVK